MTNTSDFAEHSAFLQRYLDKVEPVVPPVELPEIEEANPFPR